MTDIATNYSNDDLSGDLVLEDGQLTQDEGLDSAVLPAFSRTAGPRRKI